MTNTIYPLFNNLVTQKTILYANENNTNINGKLRSSYSLKEQGNTEIVYLRDSDFNNQPREISQVKDEAINDHDVNPADIIVVIIEIESWYYAGLSNEDCESLNLPI